MQKTDPLIRTKLNLPFIRPELVPRPRLQARIMAGLRGPLTLVIAPAGFGKTTLVASSVSGCGMPFAWLSLDKDDNSEGRFLSYLISALQGADSRIGARTTQLTATIQPAPPETILANLINDLDAMAGNIILVLDDYQLINNQAVHEGVAFLLDHRPHNLHIVIASRSDPPIPIARLRGRGQMVELRAADLSFTEPEAAQFLNKVMGLNLDTKSIMLLEERTEGWIAGLQMAALSMRDRQDVTGFIEGFSGTNRHILDYLIEEVLDSQSPEIQRFLLCTSILERLTAPLCDAVLANDEGSEEQGHDRLVRPESPASRQSASILEYLERSNLFLVSLDDERIWYRYHHLFAILLRVKLAQSRIYEEKTLHLRAAEWFERHGHHEDAIYHALAAQDYPRAASLVENLAETTWLRSEYSRLIDWIKALPADFLSSRPWLCVWYAWSLIQVGPLEEARIWVEAANVALQKPEPDPYNTTTTISERQALEYEVAILHTYIACLAEEYDRAIQLATWVLDNPPPQGNKSALVARCHVLHGLTSMYYTVGELGKAEETALETIRLSREIGFFLRYIHAVNKLASVYRARGQLSRTFQLLKDVLAFFSQQGLANYSVTKILRCRLVELLYEWNRIEEIERLVDEYGLLEPPLQIPYVCVDLYNLQARLHLLKNDLADAQSVLDKAAEMIGTSFIWSALSRQTESLQVSLWLQSGDLPLAVAWDSAPLDKDADRFPFLCESRLISRTRILIAQGRWKEGLALLDQLRASADSGGRRGSLVEIRVLMALALEAASQTNESLNELAAALELAESESYVRTFIDEGPAMARLLAKLAGEAKSPQRNYAQRLLAEWHGTKITGQHSPEAGLVDSQLAKAQALLIEPLSQRELEVLQLIALGKTNQEIARQIFVSPGTVKAHTASIYRKLDVANRTEAVARARQLGILV
jgi:LuxR family maltose regulon positive regulatory protein